VGKGPCHGVTSSLKKPLSTLDGQSEKTSFVI
jgi:hypothetical protein